MHRKNSLQGWEKRMVRYCFEFIYSGHRPEVNECLNLLMTSWLPTLFHVTIGNKMFWDESLWTTVNNHLKSLNRFLFNTHGLHWVLTQSLQLQYDDNTQGRPRLNYLWYSVIRVFLLHIILIVCIGQMFWHLGFVFAELFDNYMQQDAHEFLNYLLNTIADLLQGEESSNHDIHDSSRMLTVSSANIFQQFWQFINRNIYLVVNAKQWKLGKK